jgi:hypothetical protein
MQKLIFGRGNAKLSKDIYTFSLPAGFTCPAAKLCQSFADRSTGKITDGEFMTFRCFAASQEATYPNVRKARWHNFDLLALYRKSSEAMATLILSSLDAKAQKVRIHVSGDFFSAEYFRAWCKVAAVRSETIFYAYTKSVKIVKANMDAIPENFRLTLSEGGINDELIKSTGIQSAKVVYSPEQAEVLGLTIDHDDSHAYEGSGNFALLIHGMQKKGTYAAAALKELKRKGVKYSYN